MSGQRILRNCFREPIAEVYDAARFLDAAVSAHLAEQTEVAKRLFVLANTETVWNWTDSIWGANSPYVNVQRLPLGNNRNVEKERMPTSAQRALLHERDGYHCRFCGLPVIRPEVRKKIVSTYPVEVPWGRTNTSQHAAFQAMWAQ